MADVNAKFAGRLTTNLVVVGQAEVYVDWLPIGAIAGLDSTMYGRFTVQEVEIEAKHVNKVPSCSCNVCNGQDWLDPM